jgi:transposase
MQVKTILNLVEEHKGFVYREIRFGTGKNGRRQIEIFVRPRKGSRGECSSCGLRGPTRDHLKERSFEYVPLCGVWNAGGAGLRWSEFLGRRASLR